MKYLKIAFLFFILFGEISCKKKEILSRKDITEINVYKSSRRITNDSILAYRIIKNEFDINRFISILNEGKINRYLLLTPKYYITVSYPDTIIEIFVSENCFRTKTSTYELSKDLSQIIENTFVPSDLQSEGQ